MISIIIVVLFLYTTIGLVIYVEAIDESNDIFEISLKNILIVVLCGPFVWLVFLVFCLNVSIIFISEKLFKIIKKIIL